MVRSSWGYSFSLCQLSSNTEARNDSWNYCCSYSNLISKGFATYCFFPAEDKQRYKPSIQKREITSPISHFSYSSKPKKFKTLNTPKCWVLLHFFLFLCQKVLKKKNHPQQNKKYKLTTKILHVHLSPYILLSPKIFSHQGKKTQNPPLQDKRNFKSAVAIGEMQLLGLSLALQGLKSFLAAHNSAVPCNRTIYTLKQDTEKVQSREQSHGPQHKQKRVYLAQLPLFTQRENKIICITGYSDEHP